MGQVLMMKNSSRKDFAFLWKMRSWNRSTAAPSMCSTLVTKMLMTEWNSSGVKSSAHLDTRKKSTRGFHMRLSNRIFAISVTILAFTLAFLVSSGVAIAQAGDAAQSGPGSSAASSAVNSASIDDATMKHTAKAFVKV